MPAAADSDRVVVLPCIFQDSHDILSALDERDGFGAAFCIDGPTSYGLGVTRMIRSDPIASERLGWTRHVHKGWRVLVESACWAEGVDKARLVLLFSLSRSRVEPSCHTQAVIHVTGFVDSRQLGHSGTEPAGSIEPYFKKVEILLLAPHQP